MGNLISCFFTKRIESLPRNTYDMTPVTTKKLPIFWLLGGPGSGRNTQSKALADHYNLGNVKVAQIIINEANKDTDRGHLIKRIIQKHGKLPDGVVMDLIKEDMLTKVNTVNGFVINNFPLSTKQAELFMEEIYEANHLIYLVADVQVMMKRLKDKSGAQFNGKVSEKSIFNYYRDIKAPLAKFESKAIKIRSNQTQDEVFVKIQDIVGKYFKIQGKITSESDYAQTITT